MCSSAKDTILWLDKIGVPFTRNQNNQIAQRKFGGTKNFEDIYSLENSINFYEKKSYLGDILFENLGLLEIFSFTTHNNAPSEHVMKKIGMKKAGEFNHPNLPEGHFLERHLLYKIEKPQ